MPSTHSSVASGGGAAGGCTALAPRAAGTAADVAEVAEVAEVADVADVADAADAGRSAVGAIAFLDGGGGGVARCCDESGLVLALGGATFSTKRYFTPPCASHAVSLPPGGTHVSSRHLMLEPAGRTGADVTVGADGGAGRGA